MNAYKTILAVVLFTMLFSCSEKQSEEPIKPLKLSSNGLLLGASADGGIGGFIDLQADTIYILSGNGGYKIARDEGFMEDSTGKIVPVIVTDNFEDHIKVFIEKDMVIARRTGISGTIDRWMAEFKITDAKGQFIWLPVATRPYGGHL